MKMLKKSIVAWSGAAALASFGILYLILPYDRMLDLALSLAFGVSFAAVVRYFLDAMRSLRNGRGGADFLIFSVFAMVCVILVQRGWIIVLSVYERADWLVNSPMTILVPWGMAWAVLLALFAPDVDNIEREGPSIIYRSLALFAAGALVGFILATSFKVQSVETSAAKIWPHLANRPPCPLAEPVWGSSNKVYHVEGSPYRGMVIPDWCFASPTEAEAKGFRPPKSAVAN